MVLIDLNQEEVKRLIAIMQFSIAACPLGSISQEVEIDADKIENLIAKMEKGLE
ncbi:MAG: hypothetical protein ABI340_03330 [Nitrososphaera sp.]